MKEIIETLERLAATQQNLPLSLTATERESLRNAAGVLRKSIPVEWFKQHIDRLLDAAKTLPETSTMRAAILLRVEYYMDLVETWKAQIRG